jgi:hypothetical protein
LIDLDIKVSRNERYDFKDKDEDEDNEPHQCAQLPSNRTKRDPHQEARVEFALGVICEKPTDYIRFIQ